MIYYYIQALENKLLCRILQIRNMKIKNSCMPYMLCIESYTKLNKKCSITYGTLKEIPRILGSLKNSLLEISYNSQFITVTLNLIHIIDSGKKKFQLVKTMQPVNKSRLV